MLDDAIKLDLNDPEVQKGLAEVEKELAAGIDKSRGLESVIKNSVLRRVLKAAIRQGYVPKDPNVLKKPVVHPTTPKPSGFDVLAKFLRDFIPGFQRPQ